MCYLLSNKTTKTSFNLTLTRVYVAALDQLVRKGIYFDHLEAIRDAMRLLFQLYKIDPFYFDLDEEGARASKP